MGSGCICSKKSQSSPSHAHTIPPTHPLSNISLLETKKRQNWLIPLKSFEYFQNPLSRFFNQQPGNFKRLTIEGPPSDMRWEVWKTLFQSKSQPIPTDLIPSEFMSLIEKDLERTFPGHPFFMNQFHLQSLKELLINTVRLNPELGYCQGMNSVAGVFLLVSSNNVTESSFMMHTFIHKYAGKGLFEPNFPKVLELLTLFNKVFKARIPALFNHFQEIELDDHFWISKWFMTLFSYSFKLEAVIRFWDAIFVNGVNSMISISIGILTELKKELEGRDLGSVLEFLSKLRNLDLRFEEIILSCNRAFSCQEMGKGRKEKGMERIRLELSPDVATEISLKGDEVEGRKRANSLIIQHSPRSPNI